MSQFFFFFFLLSDLPIYSKSSQMIVIKIHENWQRAHFWNDWRVWFNLWMFRKMMGTTFILLFIKISTSFKWISSKRFDIWWDTTSFSFESISVVCFPLWITNGKNLCQRKGKGRNILSKFALDELIIVMIHDLVCFSIGNDFGEIENRKQGHDKIFGLNITTS